MAGRGRIFIVSAPSGCGKTTLCRMLARRCGNLKLSVSMTTRPKRGDERQGRDYIFVSRAEFRKKAASGGLLEWARNFGYEYGTPGDRVDAALRNGRDVILAIDVKGAMKVRRSRPDSVSIFILPPSMAVLKRRLIRRKTDSRAVIKRRLRVAEKELAYAPRYDHRVVNDTLQHAAKKLAAIIRSERSGKIHDKNQETGQGRGA